MKLINNLKIRSFELPDLNSVFIIDKESFGEDCYPFFFFRQAYDMFNDLFVIAEINGEVVGYIIGSIIHNSQAGWIISMAVKKNYRKKGIATQLIQNLVDLFSKYKITKIYLTVDPENFDALNLYQKIGFINEKSSKDYFGKGNDRIVMHMEI